MNTQNEFQEKISPILKELSGCFWENDLKAIPNNWSDDDVAYVTKIFSKVIFEKMFINKKNKNTSLEDQCEFAELTGNEIYKLVKNTTEIDLKKYYEEKRD